MIKKGDYVLATKYSDGDPNDQWCVGFYKENFAAGSETRHDVVDIGGNSFRCNGFRRVRKITHEQGEYLLNNKDAISLSKSVWGFLRLFNAYSRSKWIKGIRSSCKQKMENRDSSAYCVYCRRKDGENVCDFEFCPLIKITKE